MSDYGNPYLPPQADHAAQARYPDAPVEAGAVPDAVVEQLRNTRPWVIFLAVVGFISAALTAFMGLGVMALPALGANKDGGGVAVAAGAVYVVIGALYIWPSFGLLRYGSAIGRLVHDPRMERLTVALDNQRSFWKVIGIMTAVMIALIPVSMAVGVAFYFAKAMAGR